MPHPFDATNKYLLHARPADWLKAGGLPQGTSLQIVDADVSAISAAADKLIRVNGPMPYGAHFEFQTSLDPNLDQRVLLYNVLYRNRLGLKVRSVVFLLRPQALSASVTGSIVDRSAPEHRLEFEYKLIRVWEIPVETLMSGGVGTLPLAPISAVNESDLPSVLEKMKRRLDSEVAAEEARELWTATRILMGLRWSPDLVGQLLKGVQGMKESTTYQEIVREGIEQGIEKGRAAEVRSLLLRRGAKPLGSPDAAVRERLEAITDLHQLEDMMDRLWDGTVKTWSELLV